MTPYMTTYTGRHINPLDLKPDDICIEDIAHALACCNRFAGHAQQPISVAQHSWFVAKLLNGTEHELQGLLHDASEAYLGDIVKWIKESAAMAAYREAEARVEKTIYRVFGCDEMMHPFVAAADKLMVRHELNCAFGDKYVSPRTDYPPLTNDEKKLIGVWSHWSWIAAEEQFLHRFRRLCGTSPTVKRAATEAGAGATPV